MIFCIIFKPEFSVGKIKVDSYWVIALAGALVTILTGRISVAELFDALTADSSINPIKILVLFISMTLLSIFLDEVGFFSYLAGETLKKANKSQYRLFIYFYLIISLLTVFTSNDIIILTFTPFICYFSKEAKISPMPYLVAEFVAANSWSMVLIIGNPTNIYLATSYGVDFVTYLRVMVLPTLAAGTAAFIVLWLIFRKKLSSPLIPHVAVIKIS